MKADLEKKLNELRKKFKSIIDKLSLPEKRKEISELETQSADPKLWQDREHAKRILRKLGGLKEDIESIEKLKEKIISLEGLLKITPEDAKDDLIFIKSDLDEFAASLNRLEIKTFLSGPYDCNNAILSVHAGQGGTEACDWAAMLQRMYYRYCQEQGWRLELVDERPGEEAGVKKATLFIKGNYSYGYLRREKGTHRLIRLSPFNANNLRQTSFALVDVMPMFEEENEDVKINPSDLQIDFSHASGHGGQNVNKVSTAVRILHKPTGVVVECQTQRYQEQNRKIAMQILKGKLWQLQEEEKGRKIQVIKGQHKIAGWGNQIRSYVLQPYKLVKDLRTGWEEGDAFSVLDGKLQGFINAEILEP